MKKKFILILILFFSLTINNLYAALACKNFYKSMNEYSNTHDLDTDPYVVYDELIGFDLGQYYDESTDQFQYKRDENNYFKVGKIYSENLLKSKLKTGDILISINGEDIRNHSFASDEKVYFVDIFKDNTDNKIVIGSLNNNKIEKFEIKVKKEKFAVREPFLDLLIKSVSIDEKKGTFDATIKQDFAYYFPKEDVMVEIANKYLKGSFCYPSLKFMRDNDYSRPDWGLEYADLISRDKSLFSEKYVFNPYYEDGEKINELGILYRSEGVYKFKENYNLRNFPFDKQKLKIWIHQTINTIDDYHATPSSLTEKNLINFTSKENNIPGWNVTNVEVNFKTIEIDKLIFDGLELSMDIERKSSYYIFKIIFPIILILMVCWSAVWIDPKEIESRLTVTIVCLLSLIAYNFVIDSELPKLEYLTIMDYIILVSYIYATIPNFLSIYSFELQKKNRKLTERYEQYEKKYGLPSYLLIIILIVLINASSSPDHAIESLSWMTNTR